MEDSLVARRSRRSTAGNRMQAALAEMALEPEPVAEDDVDFVAKDEGEDDDIYESDFKSTDDEADNAADGDKMADDEERREKRAARVKSVKYATARAIASGSGAPAEPRRKRDRRAPRRVSYVPVPAVADTGEAIERRTRRETTRVNTMETVSRAKESDERRVTVPVVKKARQPRKTQAELLRAALDMEDTNTAAHRNFLRDEEARRARARLVRPDVTGPRLRYVSRKERVTLPATPAKPLYVPPPPPQPLATKGKGKAPQFVYHNPPPPPPPSAMGRGTPYYYPPTPSGSYMHPPPPPGQRPPYMPPPPPPPGGHKGPASSYPYYYAPVPLQKSAMAAAMPVAMPAMPAPPPPKASTSAASTSTAPAPGASRPSAQGKPLPPNVYWAPAPGWPSTAPPIPWEPAKPARTEMQARGYVLHVEKDGEGAGKPEWGETMRALFGRDEKWEDVQVYTNDKGPKGRKVEQCAITGRNALYREPSTGVPFADAAAYKTLLRVLDHEYVWSDELGIWVGEADAAWPS
ncbi:hypothetical protein EXIGLDRAFT_135813 [Exidia glandulosa HHB12029]|uniref:Vps72/YL1 C-terminal domain-containing protein n=1 Tax=Exidia glandulosa HHB12029 TaxID=1314781 RepID=A0A165NGM6_EXIGL|nr:hypothetical protein EXIGLDRAFT_135813 [Exidia glandulosa HHB12029]